MDKPKLDTRNWRVQKIPPGEVFDIQWVDLENADTEKDDLRNAATPRGPPYSEGVKAFFRTRAKSISVAPMEASSKRADMDIHTQPL